MLFFSRVRNWLVLRIARAKWVYYIGGSETLPLPLSREEENDVMLRLAAGDMSVKEILIDGNSKTRA